MDFNKTFVDDHDHDSVEDDSSRSSVQNVLASNRCSQRMPAFNMELLGHNFYVFTNAETDEVNVVYKRKNNTYGLIEPEFQ